MPYHHAHQLRLHTILQLVAEMVEPGHHHLHHRVRQGVQGELAAQPPQQVVNQEAARAQNQVLDDGGLLLLGVLDVGLGEVDV